MFSIGDKVRITNEQFAQSYLDVYEIEGYEQNGEMITDISILELKPKYQYALIGAPAFWCEDLLEAVNGNN